MSEHKITKKIAKRILAGGLSAAMLLTAIPILTMNANGAGGVHEDTVLADGSTATYDYYKDFLNIEDSTENAGRIWTDKSVYDIDGSDYSSLLTVDISDKTSEADFLEVFSALGSSTAVNVEEDLPLDVMFVLDMSGSMGQSTTGENDCSKTRLAYAVEALNDSFYYLMNQNDYNRVGLYIYSGDSYLNNGGWDWEAYLGYDGPDAGNGRGILNLGRYTADNSDGEYFSVKGNGNPLVPNRQTGIMGQVYMSVNVNEPTMIDDIIMHDSNAQGTYPTEYDFKTKIRAVGATHTQMGLYAAMEAMASDKNDDIKVDINGETVTRLPVVVLLTDGVPTLSDTNENWWDLKITDNIQGNGEDYYYGNYMLAMATASYMKREINNHYFPNGKDSALVFTFGIDFVSNTEQEIAEAFLNPKDNFDSTTNTVAKQIGDAWQKYRTNTSVSIPVASNKSYTLKHPTNGIEDIDDLIYNDEYRSVPGNADLSEMLQALLKSINNPAKLPIGDNGATTKNSEKNTLTYYDPIGDYMEVKDIFQLSLFGKDYKVARDDNGEYHVVDNNGGVEITNPSYGVDSHFTFKLSDIKIQVDSQEGEDGIIHDVLRVDIPAEALPVWIASVDLKFVHTDTISSPQKSVFGYTTNTATIAPLRLFYTVGMQEQYLTNGSINLSEISEEYKNTHRDPVTGRVNFYSNVYASKEHGDAYTTFYPADSNSYYNYQAYPIYTDSLSYVYDKSGIGTSYYFDYIYYTPPTSASNKIGTVQVKRTDGSVDDDDLVWYNLRTEEIVDFTQSKPVGDGNNWVVAKSGGLRVGDMVTSFDEAKDKAQNTTGTSKTYYLPIVSDLNNSIIKNYLGNNGVRSTGVTLLLTKLVDSDTVDENEEFNFTVKIPTMADKVLKAIKYKFDTVKKEWVPDETVTGPDTYQLDGNGETDEVFLKHGEGLLFYDLNGGDIVTVTEKLTQEQIDNDYRIKNVQDESEVLTADKSVGDNDSRLYKVTKTLSPKTNSGANTNNDGQYEIHWFNKTVEFGKDETQINGGDVKTVPGEDGKLHGPMVTVGDTITYRIDWVNDAEDSNGELVAATIVIKDELDEGVEYVNADFGEYEGEVTNNAIYFNDLNGSDGSDVRTVFWKFDVDAEASGYVTLTVRVTENALKKNIVDNQAFIEVDNKNGDVITHPTDVVENPVVGKAETDITSSDGEKLTPGDGEVVWIGDTITYKIYWANDAAENGELVPATVIIRDELDKGVEFVGASVGFSTSTDENGKVTEVTWELKNVDAGKSGFVTLTVRVTEEALGENKIDNKATIEVGNKSKVTNIIENPVEGKSELTPGEGEIVKPGDEIIYKISWRNDEVNDDGTPATVKVKITDKLDKGVELVEASDDGSFTEENGNVTVIWEFETSEASGYVTLKVRVTEKALESNKVENKATITVGDNPEVTTKPVENPVKGKRELTPGEGKVVKPGDKISYEITWVNDATDDKGEPAEAEVTITDVLDEGVEFVEADFVGYNKEESSTVKVVYNEDNHTVTWKIYKAKAEESGKVTLTVKVTEKALDKDKKEPGKVVNQADIQIGNNPAVTTNKVENPVEGKNETQVNDGDVETVLGEDGILHGPKVKVGDTITYEITWVNDAEVDDGEQAEYTVLITDHLDPGVQVKDSDGGTYHPENHTVTWNISAAPGASGKVTLTVIVTENALKKDENKSKVVNYADIVVTNGSTVETNKVENPVEGKIETDPGEGVPVMLGDVITYEIGWVNDEVNADGSPAEVEVTITDYLDPGVNVEDSGSGTYDPKNHTVTWKFTTSAASGFVTLKVKVTEKAYENDKVVNNAGIKVGNNPKVTTKPVENPVAKGKMEITPGEGKVVKPGDEIEYEIYWVNNATDENGEPAAATVIITDVLDDGVEFVEASDGYSTSNDENGKVKVTWTIKATAGKSGKVTLTVRVTEKAIKQDNVKNKAHIKVENESGVYTDADTNEVENPIERKTETSPGEGVTVIPGSKITYKINWVNDATNDDGELVPATITITDVLDNGVTFVDASKYGSCTEKDGIETVIWEFPAEAGASGTVTLVVKVLDTALEKGEVVNQASIKINNDIRQSNEVENPVKNGKTEETPGEGKAVSIGDKITYKINWVNDATDENGNAIAAEITITDVLDPGVDFDSAIGKGFYYDKDHHTISWKFKADPGESGAVEFAVIVNDKALKKDETDSDKDKVVNQADIQVGNNPVVTTNKIVNPVEGKDETQINNEKVVTVLKDGKLHGEMVTMGDTITYEICWANDATDNGEFVPATVTITDNLDESVEFVDAGFVDYNNEEASTVEVNYDKKNHAVTWTIDKAKAGESGKVTLTVRVTDKVFGKNFVDNQAVIQVGNDPKVDVRPTNEVENSVKLPIIEIEKTQAVNGGNQTKEKQTVEYEDKVTYYLKVRNTGEATAEDVVVTDKIPDGLTLVEKTISNDGKLFGNTIVWNIGDIEAGADVTVSFTVSVPMGIETATWTNFALISAKNDPETPPENPDNSDDPTTEPDPNHKGRIPKPSNEVVIEEGTKLTIEKTQSVNGNPQTKEKQIVKPSDEVTYYITVTNSGNAVAKDVVVTDEIPNGLTLVEKDPISDGGELLGNTIVWNIGDIQVGAEVTVSFTVRVPENTEETTWENIAAVSFENNPENPPEDSENPPNPNDPHKGRKPEDSNEVVIEEAPEPSTPVIPVIPDTPGTPNLSIEKTQSVNGGAQTKEKLTVESGDVVTYYITVTNTGSGTAEGVVVTDEIPEGLTLNAIGNSGIRLDDGKTILWNIGELAAKGVVTVSFTVTVPEVDKDTAWTNIAMVSFENNPENPDNPNNPTEPDPNDPHKGRTPKPSNEVEIAEGTPELRIEKTQSVNGGNQTKAKLTVESGDVVTYFIKITNTGSATAKDVVVSDEIPDGLTLNTIGNSGIRLSDGKTIVWKIGDLKVEEVVTVSFTVTVPEVDEYTEWTNIATVSFENDPDNPAVNPDVPTENDPENPTEDTDFSTVPDPNAPHKGRTPKPSNKVEIEEEPAPEPVPEPTPTETTTTEPPVTVPASPPVTYPPVTSDNNFNLDDDGLPRGNENLTTDEDYFNLNDDGSPRGDMNMPTGVIIGGSVGITVGSLLLAAAAQAVRKRKYSKKDK